MKQYKSLFFIKTNNYMFKYNTNNDRLHLIKDGNYFYRYYNLAAQSVKVNKVYERIMIEQAIEGEYERD